MYLMNDGSISESKPSFQTRKSYLRPIIKTDPANIHHPTQQHFKDECDINNIMKRFQTTGVLPDLIKSNPAYGDFSTVPDFLDAMNILNHAHDQFSSLSSRVRARFDNDPQQFLNFVNDPSNNAEMIELGLATKKQPPVVDPTLKALQDAAEGFQELNKTLSDKTKKD